MEKFRGLSHRELFFSVFSMSIKELFIIPPVLSVAGNYLYIEASSPRHPNDVAQLVSQIFDGSPRAFCFEFWYSMVGVDIGTLTVYLKKGNVQNPIWSLSGNQQSDWNQARFSVQSSNDFQV